MRNGQSGLADDLLVGAAQLCSAMAELPLESREIILLREHEDFSYQELAGVLDCPVATVIMRLQRARAELRTLLEKVSARQ